MPVPYNPAPRSLVYQLSIGLKNLINPEYSLILAALEAVSKGLDLIFGRIQGGCLKTLKKD